MGRRSLEDIDGVVVRETELAWLFDYGGDAPVWLPKSVCEWDADGKQMTLPHDLAVDKGMV